MHLETDYKFKTKEIEETEGIYSFDFSKLDIFEDDILSIECSEVSA